MDNSFTTLILPMLVVVLLYVVIVGRGSRKEDDERKKMLEALKKNDRVVTHSGVVGTITGTSNDGKRVTIRTGEAKIEILRSAILREYEDEKTEPDAAATPKVEAK